MKTFHVLPYSTTCIRCTFFLVKLKQDYTQLLELRLTFFSRFENMTFDHYLTKPKSMLEWKLISMLDKNP